MYLKHCGKGRKYWLPAFCLFPILFLTLSLTTNSGLFQTERAWPDNSFKLDENGRRLSKWVENTVTSNFSFSHDVFERYGLQTPKNQGLFGKGLKSFLELFGTGLKFVFADRFLKV